MRGAAPQVGAVRVQAPRAAVGRRLRVGHQEVARARHALQVGRLGGQAPRRGRRLQEGAADARQAALRAGRPSSGCHCRWGWPCLHPSSPPAPRSETAAARPALMTWQAGGRAAAALRPGVCRRISPPARPHEPAAVRGRAAGRRPRARAHEAPSGCARAGRRGDQAHAVGPAMSAGPARAPGSRA